MARMTRIVLILGALLMTSAATAADKSTKFSGIWVLEKAELRFLPVILGSSNSLSGNGRNLAPGYGGRNPQSPSDFPGDYAAPSSFPGPFVDGGGNSGRGIGGPDSHSEIQDQSITLTIIQNGAELNMERRRNLPTAQPPLSQTFMLSGKESSNPDETGRGEFRSKTRWHKEILVIRGIQTGSVDGRVYKRRLKEELSISKDGQILTIKTSQITPQGPATLTQIFRRQ